jgi:2-keto-4-pentenoate hydratase/2-oxohepta-3-ene-1,7-dioic acid hydratase in catechol pathway
LIRLFAFLAGPERRLGLADGDALFDLSAGLERAGDFHARDEIALLRRGLLRLDPLNRILEKGLPRLAGSVRFDLPVARPRKILALARNFAEHAREMGSKPPDEPVFFAKGANALLPHGAPIEIPAGLFSRVDPEGELAAIVGARARDLPEEEALEAVAGWTTLDDVTARDLQKEDRAAGRPWFRSKSFDTFCPVGPFWAPREEVADLDARRLQTRVNGVVRQSARLGEMTHSPAKVISFLSRHLTLEPGDLVAFGTPSGVGPVEPLDEVEVEIEGVSRLRNPVVRGKCAAVPLPDRAALHAASLSRLAGALAGQATREAILARVARFLDATLPHVQAARARSLDRPGAPARRSRDPARATLSVPVLDRGKAIGEIRIESRIPDAFDASDRSFLEAVAREVAARLPDVRP